MDQSPNERKTSNHIRLLQFVLHILPHPTHPQPTVSSDTLPASNQQPTTSNQPPATSHQQPATSHQQPATSHQQRETRNEKRETSNQNPATSTIRFPCDSSPACSSPRFSPPRIAHNLSGKAKWTASTSFIYTPIISPSRSKKVHPSRASNITSTIAFPNLIRMLASKSGKAVDSSTSSTSRASKTNKRSPFLSRKIGIASCRERGQI